MSFLPGYALPLLLAVGAPPGPPGWAEPARPRPGGFLSAEDAIYLDYLIDDFLFDPKGATRVRVWVRGLGRRFVAEWDRVALADTQTRDGWLVPAAPGRPARPHLLH